MKLQLEREVGGKVEQVEEVGERVRQKKEEMMVWRGEEN